MKLLVEWYVDPAPARQAELVECLRLNLLNTEIDEIHLFGVADELFRAPRHDKIRTVPVTERMTFARFFEYVSDVLPGCTCAIANSDIFFDGTIVRIDELDLTSTVLCLTRWDVIGPTQLAFNDNPGSQDAWIFKSPLRVPEAQFTPGRLACDKRLAALLAEHRQLANPSKSIHACHYHTSRVRRESVDLLRRLSPPYAEVPITRLPQTLVAIATCPRPGGASYLGETLSGLSRTGAMRPGFDRLVLCDGAEPSAVMIGWPFDVGFPRRGSRAMMWWAFRRALESGADRLIYCEDDITPCRRAVERMACVSINEEAAFMTFADRLALPDGSPDGLYVFPAAGGFEGSECLAFPRRAIEWLVQQDPFAILTEQVRDGVPVAVDQVLIRLVARSPWPNYAAHLPRLVRHEGAVSAAHPDKQLAGSRATREFPGIDFDAGAL